MRWLIAGSEGQLGTEMARFLHARDENFIAYNRNQLDISNLYSLNKIIAIDKPDVILNTAAWTNVDLAETHSDEAFKINAEGAHNLSKVARKIGAKFVHISTDYVFSGETLRPWEVTDPPNPQNVYGKSKLAGEQLIQSEYGNGTLILRTAWLHSPWKENFVKKIIVRARQNEDCLEVVSDQFGQPTSSFDLAERIHDVVQKDIEPGIYHATNSGSTNWFNLAKKILFLINEDENRIKGIFSSKIGQKAKRPTNSVLSHEKWKEVNMGEMQNWEVALSEQIPRILKQLESEN